MSTFILEIYSEEIPAKMHQKMRQKTEQITKEILIKNKILERIGIVKCYISTCRLAVVLQDFSKDNLRSNIRGPQITTTENIVESFLKKHSTSKENLTQNEGYWILNKDYLATLKDLSTNLLQQLSAAWSKKMHWNETKNQWIRPIRNICCMIDSEVVDLSFAGIVTNNTTRANKNTFLNKDKNHVITLDDAENYLKKLQEHDVIINEEERKNIILSKLNDFCQANQLNHLTEKEDCALLEEIIGLCEFPAILFAKIPEKFMIIPQCILATTMKDNQRYIPLYRPNGNMSEIFCLVAEAKIANQDHAEIILTGNQKVLNARLKDADFFWQEDRQNLTKAALESESGKGIAKLLQKIPFHPQFGTVYSRARRIFSIMSELVNGHIWLSNDLTIELLHQPHKDSTHSCMRELEHFKNHPEKWNWALLCSKLDLGSKVVQEFPELQGKIGAIYWQDWWCGGDLENFGETIKAQYHAKMHPNNNLMHRIFLIANAIEYLACHAILGNRATSSSDEFAIKRNINNCITLAIGKNFTHNHTTNQITLINIPINKTDMANLLPMELKDAAEDLTQIFEERFLTQTSQDGDYNPEITTIATHILNHNNAETNYPFSYKKQNKGNKNIILALSTAEYLQKNHKINYEAIAKIVKRLQNLTSNFKTIEIVENVSNVNILEKEEAEKITLQSQEISNTIINNLKKKQNTKNVIEQINSLNLYLDEYLNKYHVRVENIAEMNFRVSLLQKVIQKICLDIYPFILS